MPAAYEVIPLGEQRVALGNKPASSSDIARQARVGPVTLYRHFPTREELLEAVYRTEVRRLVDMLLIGSRPIK